MREEPQSMLVNGYFTVMFPNDRYPLAKISQEVTPQCEEMILRGSYSKPFYGNTLLYRWDYQLLYEVGPSFDNNIDAIHQLDILFSSSFPDLILPISLLEDHLPILITLTVFDFLQLSSSSSFEVFPISRSIIAINLIIANIIIISRYKYYYLHYQVRTTFPMIINRRNKILIIQTTGNRDRVRVYRGTSKYRGVCDIKPPLYESSYTGRGASG